MINNVPLNSKFIINTAISISTFMFMEDVIYFFFPFLIWIFCLHLLDVIMVGRLWDADYFNTSFNLNPSSLSSNANAACAFRGRHPDPSEKLLTFLNRQLPNAKFHFHVLEVPHAIIHYLELSV